MKLRQKIKGRLNYIQLVWAPHWLIDCAEVIFLHITAGVGCEAGWVDVCETGCGNAAEGPAIGDCSVNGSGGGGGTLDIFRKWLGRGLKHEQKKREMMIPG